MADQPVWRLHAGVVRAAGEGYCRRAPADAGCRHGIACGLPVEGAVWPPLNINHGENNNCSPNFSFYQIGSRTQWNVTSNFYMGIDVTYTHLNTAYQGVTVGNPVVSDLLRQSKRLVRHLPDAAQLRSGNRTDRHLRAMSG